MKKRKFLWIGGALAATVALSAAIVSFVAYNSTDARINRAVAQIVEEDGFVLKSREPGYFGWSQRKVTNYLCSRAPMGAGTAGEVVAILREANPSFEYRQMSGGDTWMEVHRFRPEEQDEGWTARIMFVPDDLGMTLPGNDPVAYLNVIKFERPSPWQWIKGLWPW